MCPFGAGKIYLNVNSYTDGVNRPIHSFPEGNLTAVTDVNLSPGKGRE